MRVRRAQHTMLCRVDRGDQGRLDCRVCQTRLYPGTIRLERCMDSQIHFSSKSKDGMGTFVVS